MRIKDRHRLVIKMLIAGEYQSRAAKKVGVSPGAVQKWLKDDDFIKEYNKERNKIDALFDKEMENLLPLAHDAVRDVLISGKDGDKINAADKVFRVNKKYEQNINIKGINNNEDSKDNLKKIEDLLGIARNLLDDKTTGEISKDVSGSNNSETV